MIDPHTVALQIILARKSVRRILLFSVERAGEAETMIHLLNGSKEIRVRSSEGCTVLDCGCAHTDVMWLQQCDEHYQERVAIHRLAAETHALDKDDVKVPQ